MVNKLLENYIHREIKRTLNEYKILLESELNFDYLFNINDRSDITKEIMQYISWSQMGMSNPTFSKAANQLHIGLMSTLGLEHSYEEDRKKFILILNYIKTLKKRINIKSIKTYWASWLVYTDSENMIEVNPMDFETNGTIYNPKQYGVVFQTNSGVEFGEVERRPHFDGYDGGWYYRSAKMTDEMKQKIYSMGLVPALLETGSFHENFFSCLGILPEMASKIKEYDKNNSDYPTGIHFSCEYKAKI